MQWTKHCQIGRFMNNNLDKISHDLGIKSNIKADEINLILDLFPYFEVFHYVFLKHLKSNNDFNYPIYLRRAIAHIKDRNLLYKSINDYKSDEEKAKESSSKKDVNEEKETKTEKILIL